MSFGEKLQELRHRKELSQSDLANQLNVSKSTISMYENNQRKPDFELLERIADYFNVDTDYLLGREGGSTYYLDPEVAQLAQEIHDDPNLHMMLSASRKIKKEDLEAVITIIKGLDK